jgi:hypothetical protein
MNHLKRSKKFLVAAVVMAVFFVLLLTYSSSFAQQTVKPTTVRKPLKLRLKSDLAIKIIRCPRRVVKAGEDLGAGFSVIGRSTFSTALKDITVDIILTSKPIYPAPAPYAAYSANYSDNVLLKGGREHISFTGPDTVNVKLNGSNTIPADTPPGIYYLGTVIDAGNKISESNERNNVHFCKIKVIGEQRRMADLIVPSLRFKKVKSLTDSQGNPYWIFNVIITVRNQGNAPAGPFKVLLERNVGPDGTYTKACITCEIDVAGLAAGQSKTLPPRQFNNANNMNSLFRATADSTHSVPESDESNNMNATSFR